MNYIYNIGHIKTAFSELFNGDFAVASYMYIPEHDIWVLFSGSIVSADEASNMMIRLASKAGKVRRASYEL